ncbi:MAG: alpha/beta hydrolase-fold protein [Bacteroidota bacterium]
MKRLLYITTIISLLAAGVYFIINKIKNKKAEREHQAWVATLEHTASENVNILKDAVTVDYLNEKRTLAVYLPENYQTSEKQYPVIYFLDGQSLFDQKIQEGTEWEVDEVMDSLSKEHQAIVIGVYNSHRRMREYKPFPSTKIYSHKWVSGDKHAEWIATDLKAWVDQRYRTITSPEATIIGGASLGGLMSYYMLNEFPEVYGAAIVFSPSFWVNPKVYELHKNNPAIKEQKIYFNAGELETPTVNSIQKMHQILLDYGVPSRNMQLDVEAGLGHWHMTWVAGYKKVYPWMMESL